MKTVERYGRFLTIARQLEEKDLTLLLILDFLFHKRGKYHGLAVDIGGEICNHIIRKWDGDTWCKSVLCARRIGDTVKRNITVFNFCFDCMRTKYQGRWRYAFDGVKQNGDIRLIRLAVECEIEARRRGRNLPCGDLAWLSIK